METKRPMLWTRVDQEVADEAQRLADEHYDGNLSMFVRKAVDRFAIWLKALPVDVPAQADADDRQVA